MIVLYFGRFFSQTHLVTLPGANTAINFYDAGVVKVCNKIVFPLIGYIHMYISEENIIFCSIKRDTLGCLIMSQKYIGRRVAEELSHLRNLANYVLYM
jgi:hypothetical protein